jgi:hypothetical protein
MCSLYYYPACNFSPYDCRDAAIPLLTLIIGGNLVKGNNLCQLGSSILFDFHTEPTGFNLVFTLFFSLGLRVSGLQKSIIAGIVVVKYIALPLTGILIVKLALKLGFVSNDPLYLFVLLLQFSVPPAMNMGI